MGECLCSPVRLLHRRITALYDEALRPHGVTSAQLNLLTAIEVLQGRATAPILVDAMAIEKSTLSRDLAGLQALGWVERAAVPGQRATALRLTPKGRRLLDALLPAWEDAQRRARELLDDEPRRWLRAFGRKARTEAREKHAGS